MKASKPCGMDHRENGGCVVVPPVVHPCARGCAWVIDAVEPMHQRDGGAAA